MGWRGGKAAVAIAALFLFAAFAPMASSHVHAELGIPPSPGVPVNSYTEGNQTNPDVFATGDGKVYVVWQEEHNGKMHIFFAMSADDGQTFGERKRVDDIGESTVCFALDPVVVVDSTGKVFVAWSDNRDGTYKIFMATYEGGNQFSSEIMVSEPTHWANQTLPDLAIWNDNLFLVWSEQQPLTLNNNTYVKYSYSTDSGNTFAQSKRVVSSPTTVRQLYPSISVRNSTVCVAWHDSRSNALFDIYMATSTNNGQNFPTAVRVSDVGAVEHWYPTVQVLPNGKAFLAWQERRSGSFDIVGKRSTTDFTTFSSLFVIDSAANDQSAPASSVDPRGVVSVVYRSLLVQGHRIMYTRSNDATAFRTPETVNNVDAEQSSACIVSVSNGTAYIAFHDDRNGGSDYEDVFLSKVIDEMPTVSIVQPVSGSTFRDVPYNLFGTCGDPDTTPILQVQVQLQEKGGAIALPWTQANVVGQALWNLTFDPSLYDNGDYEIWARSYDGALYSLAESVDVIIDNSIQSFINLRITSADIVFYPPHPIAGDGVTISANVTNLGNTDAFNVQVQFFRGALSLGYSTISRVGAGTQNNTVFSWTALEGTFTFRATVDPSNLIEETNESDNTATRSLTVDPVPVNRDLEVGAENVTYSPSIAHVNDMLNISAQVYNFGSLIVTGVRVEFDVDGSYYALRTIDSINPGLFKVVHINWTAATAGAHSVTVVVDPLPHDQEDDDRANNQATLFFTVYAENVQKVDLQISNASVLLAPTVPKLGQNVTISVVVNNNGDIDAEQVTVSFYMDGLPIGTRLIPIVEHGMAGETSLVWQAILGNRVLTVKVDEADSISEANESNNLVVRQFTVLPAQMLRPDLYVDAGNITLFPDPPDRGRVLKFNVTVWNLGNDSATNVVVVMKIDGNKLDGDLHIGYLAPGLSTTLTGSWMPTGGRHTFEVVVDPDNQTAEWSEADNSAQRQFDLPSDPISTDVLVLILAVVAFAVLGLGIYSFAKARARRKGKK